MRQDQSHQYSLIMKKLLRFTWAHRTPLNVLCSYKLTAMVKLALLRYLSEFRLRVSSF